MKKLLYILPLILIFSCRKSRDLVPVENVVAQVDTLPHTLIHDTLTPPGGWNYTLRQKNTDLINLLSWNKPILLDTVTGHFKFVILLTFDGFNAINTNWAMQSDFVVEPSGFTLEQQDELTKRFGQFWKYQTIYVTSDSRIYDRANPIMRVRIVYTQTAFSGMIAGTAYLNSFFWGNDTPAFVFTSLLNYNIENCARAGTHEAGHTLGLRHQADGYFSETKAWVKTAEYRRGTRGKAILMGYLYGGKEAEWGYGRDPFGNLQKDTEHIEKVTGGRYTPQGTLNPPGE